MKNSLRAGLTSEFQFTIPPTKTVPHLYPESELFQQMPEVLATGFMVGLIEWACAEAIKPHLDWPREQTLGTDVKFSHLAPTPPGFTVKVNVTLIGVEGRKLTFAVTAHDGIDRISSGLHERFIIDAAKFNAKVAAKRSQLANAGQK
ncbi:MAG: thioesterase family protein [Burkholderiales bacterium]|nr:thioesterase family protein [Burkholderiales bacterium]